MLRPGGSVGSHLGLRQPAQTSSSLRIASSAGFMLLLVHILLVPVAEANWFSNDISYDFSYFSNDRSWIEEGDSVSIQVDGCIYFNSDDGEDAGCLEQSSEDGTSSWFMMQNCLRAHVAFSVYSGSSCKSNTYKETFLAMLPDFIYYMQIYDPNNPFGDGGDDDGGNNYGYNDLPYCEQGNNGYIGVGCSSDGTFELSYFDDTGYCLYPTGSTYDNLNSINKIIKNNYRSCRNLGYGNDEGGGFGNVVKYLSSCNSMDDKACSDSASVAERKTGASSTRFHIPTAGKSIATKFKYGIGALLLVGCFIMFTGILFTNRRRRRALIQRKYRMSRKNKSGRSRRSKSRSKSRDARSKSRDARSTRSKRSKSRSQRLVEAEGDDVGVMT